MYKLIKDVVHGYISFDEKLTSIINSSEFQRLKNIRQTSYNSLYPSSLHDRFTHSIGVYELGRYAFEHFQENVSTDYKDKSISADFWKKTKEIFLLACLLHDIGHSPFSHTGEYFYLRKHTPEDSVYIYDELTKIVKKPNFSDQFKESIKKDDVAKPHEIMSSIIGIKRWLSEYSADDKELFARMIIGLQYKDDSEIEIGIYNALIYLLNSSVIDVDKLDYLLRDKMMTGFEGVSIDTERLLASVCLVSQKTGHKEKYHLAYYKNALSVIENVVVAHDSEKKWIQTHAVVSYDSFLVQRCIKAIESNYSKEAPSSVFCEEALGYDGIKINGQSIRLLSDADIIYLAKQISTDDPQYEYIDEYFNRSIRKKAIWKSESEFDLMLRELGDDNRKLFVDWMDDLSEELKTGSDSFEHAIVINETIKEKLQKDYKLKQQDSDIPQTEKDSALEILTSVEQKFSLFEEFANSKGIKFNFVITWHKRFTSNVDKFHNDDVLIKYKNFDQPKPIGSVISTYSLNKQSAINRFSRLYYIYYNRNGEETISPKEFILEFIELIKKSNS